MKIFGKRINNIISLIFGGKPVTIIPKDSEDMEQTLDLVRKANTGDEKAEQELSSKIVKPIEEVLPELAPSLKQAKEEVKQAEQIYEDKKTKFTSSNFDILNNNPDFTIKEGKVYLTNFEAEIPNILVEKFVELVNKQKDYSHLVKFWQMTLLNPNPEARRGLYKFIVNQKLIVTSEGYFVAFRKLVKKSIEKVLATNSAPDQWTAAEINTIQEFATKVKKWKKSTKNFAVYSTGIEKLSLKDLKKGSSKNIEGELKGTLEDLLHSLNDKAEMYVSEQIYTDNYTKKMFIRLNYPVRLDRSLCNENGSETCSNGLHFGSISFAGSVGSSYGDAIVAVLVNPMHVVSVPYSGANKMRGCEYFPFMVVTNEDLKNFEKLDISSFEKKYKALEEEKLKEALLVIDELTQDERQQFSNKNKITQKDLDQSKSDLNLKKAQVKSETHKFKHLLDDNLSNNLNLDEIRLIIKNRLK